MIRWYEKINKVYVTSFDINFVFQDIESLEEAYADLNSWDFIILGIYRVSNRVEFYMMEYDDLNEKSPYILVKEDMPLLDQFIIENKTDRFSPFYIFLRYFPNVFDEDVSAQSFEVVCNGIWMMPSK